MLRDQHRKVELRFGAFGSSVTTRSETRFASLRYGDCSLTLSQKYYREEYVVDVGLRDFVSRCSLREQQRTSLLRFGAFGSSATTRSETRFASLRYGDCSLTLAQKYFRGEYGRWRFAPTLNAASRRFLDVGDAARFASSMRSSITLRRLRRLSCHEI